MDISSLPFDVRSTVADSLADYIESFENGADASDETLAIDFFSKQADNGQRVLDFFLQGRELNDADLGVINSALESSYENCVALGLDDAANGYSAAALLIFGDR